MNKLASIRSRVLILAILPALIIGTLLTAHSIQQSLHALDRGLHERGRTIAMQLAAASEYGVVSGNSAILHALVQQTMQQQNDIRSIVVTDNTGQVLVHNGQPVPEEAILHGQNASQPDEWRAQKTIMFSAPVRRTMVPVDDYENVADIGAGIEPRMAGQVLVTLETAALDSLKNKLVTDNLLIALIGLLASGLIGWRIGRGISQPVLRLAEAVRRVAQGQLDTRIAEKSAGELGALERGFNDMAARLKSAHGSLQERIDEATQQLRYQARHDALTGLVNRRELELRLERALKRTHEEGAQHVFCYMDLDQFKIVNDTCGHHAGDALLRQLSMILRHRIRETDTLARLGGDEFGLLLEDCSMNDARIMTQGLLELVREFRYVHENKVFCVGISIGMVAIDQHCLSVEGLLSAADTACFAAKDNGRNRIHVFEPEDDDLARRHGEMQWVARLTKALQEDRFCLHAQPILPLVEEANAVPYFEILLRKISKDGRLIPPMAFIPAAERFHMMPAIDRWVIRHAFAAYRTLLDTRGPPCPCVFTINLSGVSLNDPGLLGYILDQLAAYEVPPTSFCFEITETAAIVNLGHTVELIGTLRQAGCGFLLDDFGSGMSSFAYLKNLQVDFIKIDGTFIKDIAYNPIDLAMVQSIHGIAQAMSIRTIAEFVESAEALQTLVTLGVHYGQGFHLGKPMPLEDALALHLPSLTDPA